MTAGDFARLCRSMAPEALEALRAALKNPRERVVAAEVLLDRAFAQGSLAVLAETAGPVRFTFIILGARDDIEGEAGPGPSAGEAKA